MTIIDDRTASLNLPKPHADNALSDDVVRLRDSLDAIDVAVAGKLPAASASAFGLTLLGDVSSGAARSTLGLGSVENKSSATIRGEITAGNVVAALTFTPENAALKGAANGYAGLDSGGKVPASQLPAYVDDVIEVVSAASLPGSGSAGVIYVTLDNNKSFRWGGSGYVEISASPGSTDVVAEGSVNLYFTYQRVRDAVLAGLSTATNAVISAADSVLVALGKLQRQISDNLTTLGNHTGNTGNPHGVTAAQAGAQPADADLTAIAALAGTSGMLKKTAANTWALDTGVFITASSTEQLTNKDVNGGVFSGVINQTGSVRGVAVPVAALNIDCSLGNYFTKTVSGASTFTVSNVPTGCVYGFTLEATHVSGAFTWFSGVQWPASTVPSPTAGKTHLFMFVTDDGGARWRASAILNYVN